MLDALRLADILVARGHSASSALIEAKELLMFGKKESL